MLSTIYLNHNLNANVRHDIIDMDDFSTDAFCLILNSINLLNSSDNSYMFGNLKLTISF